MSSAESWLLRTSVRFYRVLLRGYPEEFRERHGQEMICFFRDRARDALERSGVVGLATHWLAALRDVVINATAERAGRGRRAGATQHFMDRGNGNEEGRGRVMEGLMKDIGYALRALRKVPGFTAVAVITIALGIGANTAIFSVVQTVLLRPLPYEDPEELVLVWGEMTNRGVENFPHSPPDFQSYREATTTFDGLAAVFTFAQALTGDFEPQQVQVSGVTTNFFSLLGEEPMIGRDFVESEGDPVAPGTQPGDPGFVNNAGILSYGLWQRRFGSDPGVLGRIVEVGGTPTEIVGVMPPGFELLTPPAASTVDRADLWTAMRLDYDNAPRNNVFLAVLGRLKPGVTVEQAQTEMDRLAADLRSQYTVKETAGFELEVASMHAELTDHVRPVILALVGAVGFVLLIACANVSNLLLVRASTRERELAVRAALGGSRGRLVRQLFSESLLLALGGAAVGVGLAYLGIELLLALQPEDLPRIESVAIDGPVLGFTMLAALVAALIFGLLPTIKASRPDLADCLKDRGRTAALASSKLLRNGVVVTEVALSLVLLIGAGLMVRSFVELNRTDPGFEPEGVLTFGVAVPFARYPDAAERSQLAIRLQERLEAVPGVTSATSGLPLPLTGQAFNGRWGGEEALTDPEAFRQANYFGVLPGFFETLGSRLLAGRALSHADNADSAAVVVVNRALADEAFPERSPVGERILVRVTRPDEPEWVEIVGVVEDQRHRSLAEPARAAVYFTERYVGSFPGRWAVRTAGNPLAVAGAVREAVAAVDPQVPVDDIQPLTAFVDEQLAATRFALILIAVFGGIALLLASVGLYGVLSYVARQRSGEIGVRMAFGAEKGNILRLVVGQGMALTLVGVAIGLLAAVGLTRLMSSLLVGVEPTDPLTFAAISGLFLLVALVSCYIPAARAARTDPVVALREE